MNIFSSGRFPFGVDASLLLVLVWASLLRFQIFYGLDFCVDAPWPSLRSFSAFHSYSNIYSLIIDFTKPAIGMMLAFVAIVSYRAMTGRAGQEDDSGTFGKYVSRRSSTKSLNSAGIGGVDKELTVFFSDIGASRRFRKT
jgi:hypothetical protein